jgi:GTP-binding protein
VKRPPVTFVGSARSPEQFPRDGLPEVAFLGRSNVGKSSLLNALAGVRNLARVSATPGRTRLVNFFRVGHEMYLADLPGYGYARAAETERRGWEGLVTSYLIGREPLALCVFLVDARHEPAASDETLRAWLDHHALPYVIAATKADKLGRGERARATRALAEGLGRGARQVMSVSARTREGVDELWAALRRALRERSAAPARRAQPPAREPGSMSEDDSGD